MRNQLVLRLFILVASAVLPGCSAIVSNHYFIAEEKPSSNWKTEYTPGENRRSKSMPTLDRIVNKYKSTGLELHIWSGFQKHDSIGPLLLPVVPLFDLGIEGELEIYLLISCEDCSFDLAKLKLEVNGKEYLPTPDEINEYQDKHYFVKYDISLKEVKRFTLYLDKILPEAPRLNAVRQRGEWFWTNATL